MINWRCEFPNLWTRHHLSMLEKFRSMKHSFKVSTIKMKECFGLYINCERKEFLSGRRRQKQIIKNTTDEIWKVCFQSLGLYFAGLGTLIFHWLRFDNHIKYKNDHSLNIDLVGYIKCEDDHSLNTDLPDHIKYDDDYPLNAIWSITSMMMIIVHWISI
jgi:hypothetical protein